MCDVLRRIGPHIIHACILNWIPLLTRCAQDRDEKTIGALKHILTWKMIRKKC